MVRTDQTPCLYKHKAMDNKEKPVTVHITNHNQFQKGVGAFITNLNHLTLVMDAEGNMKMDAVRVPVMPHTQVDAAPDSLEEEREEDDDGRLVSELMPLFYNNEADVRRFLKEIRGMAQEDITDVVNRWVSEKRISDYGNSRKGGLWSILHEAGLYTRSKTNWNKRVI